MYHYWALFTLKWHYLGYFDVIRIHIRICEPDADFDQDMDPDIPNLPLLALICHYLAYFGVIRIQIQIFVPDANFDQDGSRYTQLTVMYHYWP